MFSKQRLLDITEVIDAYRMVPRILLGAVGYLVWDVISWYKALPNPTTEQAALVTVVTAIIPLVINFYQSSGRKWEGSGRNVDGGGS